MIVTLVLPIFSVQNDMLRNLLFLNCILQGMLFVLLLHHNMKSWCLFLIREIAMDTKITKSSDPSLLKFRLTGVNALILHNGDLADPLNKFAKEMKKVSSKKMKTEADLERLAELEFKGGLYVNEKMHPILPPEGIKACIVSGAKKSKEGQVAKAGVWVPKAGILEYEGPKTVDSLWQDENFRLRNRVRIKTNTVMRTRPIFKEWACAIEVQYNSAICNPDQIHNWLKVCGEQCGSFDWRPDYGHFTVERL